MKIYQYRAKQFLPITINEAWEFFSNPNNLPKITPPWLNFEVTTQPDSKMYAGMIITYLVHPLLNIPTTWVTEITHVSTPNFFLDEQRFGPYKLWHHQHHFKETEKGVEMTDIVSYALPLDPLSRPINSLLVEKKIKEIFKFREKKLEELFPFVIASEVKQP